VVGTRVLDLFAGSGALGLEALSRGAKSAVFVESNAKAAEVLQKNVQILGAEESSRVVAREVSRTLPILAEAGPLFDWIFADPPWGGNDGGDFLRWMEASGEALLAPGGGVLLEIGRRDERPESTRLRLVRERVVGETVLCFLAWAESREDRNG
jgi:16S rRNA (guanine966-N2)-methyltransferase